MLKSYLEEFCIRVTSGPDPKLCRDTYALDYEKWAGDEIKLKHNGEVVATLGYGFRDFSKCLKGKGVHRPYTEPVDRSGLRLELQATVR